MFGLSGPYSSIIASIELAAAVSAAAEASRSGVERRRPDGGSGLGQGERLYTSSRMSLLYWGSVLWGSIEAPEQGEGKSGEESKSDGAILRGTSRILRWVSRWVSRLNQACDAELVTCRCIFRGIARDQEQSVRGAGKGSTV